MLRGLTRGVTAYIIDPEGEYADMARAAGGRVISPGIEGQGMNPFVIDKGDAEELLQRIGSLRRLIEVMVGEKLGAERQGLPGPRPWPPTTPSPGSAPGSRTSTPSWSAKETETSHGLLRPFATGSLRHLLTDEGDDLLSSEASVTVFNLRLLEPELRPAAAMVCTETVWAAAAPEPQAPSARGGRGVEHHAAPRGGRLHDLHGQASEEAPPGPPVHHPGRPGPPLRRPLPDHYRTLRAGAALLQNAAFKLLLQQDAAAISTVGDAFDLPQDLQRWLLSCPRGDGLLLARGGRFPIRIEATPEETAVIEWRPGTHK